MKDYVKMNLHYKLQGEGQPIIFLHGVFGSLDNSNMLAKHFVSDYQTIQVDLRNHGQSPWSNEMNLNVMAEDIAALCHHLQLDQIILIGHSMGGKVALRLTQIISEKIKKIVALDIAPVKYPTTDNAQVLESLSTCLAENLTDKKQIIDLMQSQGLSEGTIQFLLKSFKNGHWLFNANVIVSQYSHLRDWQPISPWYKPTFFVRGSNSNYVMQQYYEAILRQFPNAVIETIEGAGHNVHAEKTQQVLQLLKQWL